MRLAWLMDTFNGNCFGRIAPKKIRMGERAFNDYQSTIVAKLEWWAQVRAKSYFLGAEVILDPSLPPNSIEFAMGIFEVEGEPVEAQGDAGTRAQ